MLSFFYGGAKMGVAIFFLAPLSFYSKTILFWIFFSESRDILTKICTNTKFTISGTH